MTRNRRVDRDIDIVDIKSVMIPPPLFANIAQCILGTALVELIEHDQIGEVEHVDLFQLTGCAILTGHHIQRKVDKVDDLTVALTDAGGLDDDDVETLGFEEQYVITQHLTRGKMLSTRCDRTHEDVFGTQRVHADAIAQQRAARATPRWVDGEHGNPF